MAPRSIGDINDGSIFERAFGPDGARVSKAAGDRIEKSVRIFKTEEERYVLGIVLEPTLEMGEADSQGDVYSAEEVRQAAYGYMENSQAFKVQHQGEANNEKIKVLESWIQRNDDTIEGQQIVAGTWLLGVRIVDDELWAAVKAGRYTGFSIGGVARREPVGGASS